MPHVEPLSEAERDDALEGLPEWDWDEGRDAITRSFAFADFSEAFAFMTRVAMLAESARTITPNGRTSGTGSRSR